MEVEQYADYAIITNDNPRGEDPEIIAKEILDGFTSRDSVEMILDREKAIAHAIMHANRGDTILIAGKGHETYQQFGKTVVAFDDREVARSVLG